jgi:hypothetical protein
MAGNRRFQEDGTSGNQQTTDAMKSNFALTRKVRVPNGGMSIVPEENDAGAVEPAATPKHLRRLKWNERVTRGDFVADGREGFEPWAGPAGFRADAFVKPIYRRSRPPRTKSIE